MKSDKITIYDLVKNKIKKNTSSFLISIYVRMVIPLVTRVINDFYFD